MQKVFFYRHAGFNQHCPQGKVVQSPHGLVQVRASGPVTEG